MVVEDDALQRMSLEELLSEAGFEPIGAASASAAVTLLEQGGPAFSAVITDIRLGSGGNGWDVGRAARELFPMIPIVYVSGDSAHEWSANGVPDSIMIQKPYALPQVTTALATLLNARSLLGE